MAFFGVSVGHARVSRSGTPPISARILARRMLSVARCGRVFNMPLDEGVLREKLLGLIGFPV
jgi:hypothetical protein